MRNSYGPACSTCGLAEARCRCNEMARFGGWRSRRVAGALSPPLQAQQVTTRKTAMHDIDRVRLEIPSSGPFETPELEEEQFEFEATGSAETEQVFAETENMELASNMLEVSN